MVLLAACGCAAIVIRHDLPDARYQVSPAEFPAVAFLPGEGHGTLIAKRWVLTAAHAITWRPMREITLNGVSLAVAKVIVHPGYKAAPKEMQSGDAAPLMRFMAASDDIALIQLQRPVDTITPIAIYRGSDEVGQIAKIVGRGATGNGVVGQYSHSPHSGALRRAYSRIISADERWLGLRFDAPPNTVDLEGMPADGDSGAPVLIQVGGTWQLAGVASRKYAIGKLSEFRCCTYGQITYQVRVSRYAAWIDNTIGTDLP